MFLRNRRERATDHYPVDPSPLRKALWLAGTMLPGNWLKTAFYLNAIERPRRLLRLLLTTFYRMDHVYAVLREAKALYRGTFSILEFGTSDGYAFTKILYAVKYLGMTDRVTVHTFDSFEGLPPSDDERDRDLITDNSFVAGEFRGRYEELEGYCVRRYQNYRIHKGYFEDTLTDAFVASLQQHLPILVWIDCDYYSSARTVWERLKDHLPGGCVIYFDEYERLNFGSRFTGEARLVHEINHGHFGDDVELVLDTRLSLDTPRVYRFIRSKPSIQYQRTRRDHSSDAVHRRTNDSPLP